MSSQKLWTRTASAPTRPPVIVKPLPTMNPSRRPTRRMMNEAGIVPSAVPIVTAVAGSVARALSAARA